MQTDYRPAPRRASVSGGTREGGVEGGACSSMRFRVALSNQMVHKKQRAAVGWAAHITALPKLRGSKHTAERREKLPSSAAKSCMAWRGVAVAVETAADAIMPRHLSARTHYGPRRRSGDAEGWLDRAKDRDGESCHRHVTSLFI